MTSNIKQSICTSHGDYIRYNISISEIILVDLVTTSNLNYCTYRVLTVLEI